MHSLADQQRVQSHQQEIFELYQREYGLKSVSRSGQQPRRSLVWRVLEALTTPRPHMSRINLVDFSDWD